MGAEAVVNGVERRRRRRYLGAFIIIAVVGWFVGVVALALQAKGHIDHGLVALETAEATLDVDSLSSGRAVVPLRAARVAFTDARGALTALPLLPVRHLPVVGRHLRSVIALSGAAAEVASAGEAAADGAAGALAVPPTDGPARVAALGRLDEVIGSTSRRLAAVDLGPERALVAPLAERRRLFAERLAEARSSVELAQAGSGAALEILTGPRRYLLLAANNAEMRAGSGMFLSVGVLDVEDGSLRLGDIQSTGDLAFPDDRVPLTGDFADRWGWLHPNREWRNLGVTPRFDQSAALAAEMWASRTGQRVDGVLALDVEAVRALLAVTGPVDAGGRQVSADEVTELLLHGQYLEFPDTQSARREQLGLIAAAAVAAVEDGGAPLAELAIQLGAAVRGRHVLAWSGDAEVERGFEVAGMAGMLDATSLSLAVQNRGGNKLDYFVRVGAELVVRPAGPDTEVEITIDVVNQTPTGQPAYVAGPYPGVRAAKDEYVGLVTLSVPGAATSVSFDGSPSLAVYGPDGPSWVIATEVRLPRTASRRLVLRFRLPGGIGRMSIVPSARIPPVEWQVGDRRFSDAASETVTW